MSSRSERLDAGFLERHAPASAGQPMESFPVEVTVLYPHDTFGRFAASMLMGTGPPRKRRVESRGDLVVWCPAWKSGNPPTLAVEAPGI